jgi:CBS domain-containing protein
MNETCESVMSRNVSACSESDTVADAAQLMRERNIGMIPVIDINHQLKGVVTDRDLTLRVLAENKNAKTKLQDVMTSGNLVTVSPKDSLRTAEEKMIQHQTGRALVTDEHGRVVGVISRSEIARAEPPERAGHVLSSLTQGHGRQRA